MGPQICRRDRAQRVCAKAQGDCRACQPAEHQGYERDRPRPLGGKRVEIIRWLYTRLELAYGCAAGSSCCQPWTFRALGHLKQITPWSLRLNWELELGLGINLKKPVALANT